jgi:hypothetical protein
LIDSHSPPSGRLLRSFKDEFKVVTINKARLMAKCYSQVEGLNFDETFYSRR